MVYFGAFWKINQREISAKILYMAKSFLKLYKSRPLRDGTYTINIIVGYGRNMRLSTGISVPLREWDENTQLCTGKSARILNNALGNMLSRVNTRMLDLRDSGKLTKLDNSQLKKLLQDMNLDADNVISDCAPTLGSVFEKIISLKNKRNAEMFSNTLKKLSDFRDPYKVSFEDVTKMWLNEFNASMSGLSVNTRAINMRNLRHVFNCAIDEGITNNYPFRRFCIQTEETPMRVLPIETLRYYRTALGLTKYETEHRDMFMLIFYLIGINIVDLSRLTRDSIVNGRIEYRRAKTGKLYSIKIEPEAQEILDKYRGKAHLLRAFDRYANYKDYAQHINAAMAGIGPLVENERNKRNGSAVMTPLEKKVTTYWARYSWATYAAELDIPKDTISEALGHAYGAKVTGVYIKYNRDKVDEANRKVIDYLLLEE